MDIYSEDVLEFIRKFISDSYGFEINGIRKQLIEKLDYWFASVLRLRFIREGAQIVYDKAQNHFLMKLNYLCYDASGIVQHSNNVVWEDTEDFREHNSLLKRQKIKLD